MEIRVNLATNSHSYTKGVCFDELKGIVICTASTKNFEEFFSSVNKGGLFAHKCPHYYIDLSGSIYQVLPENYKGKFAGKKVDDSYIQIVVQEPKNIIYQSATQFTVPVMEIAREDASKQYKSLLGLCTTLCVKYSFEPYNENVLLSHNEAFREKLANAGYGIDHVWNGLGINIYMGDLRKGVHDAIYEGKGYFHEGTDYSYVFDPEYYDRVYPDLAAICQHNKGKLFRHFIDYGMSECRKGNEDFDVVLYIENNPDLAFGSDWGQYYKHYCNVHRLQDEKERGKGGTE